MSIIIITSVLSGCKTAQKGRSFFPLSSNEKKVVNDKLFIDAIALKTKGENEKAINIFSQILKSKDPEKAPVYYELARIYKSEKKFDDALSNINAAIDLNARNKWYYELKLQLAYNMQDVEEIEATYKSRKAAFPKNTDYNVEFSDFYLTQKKFLEVLKLYDEIESSVGVSKKLNHKKFLIYKGLDEYEKAEKEIRKLIKTFPRESEFYIELAKFKMFYGEEQSALEAYEEGLRNIPNDPYVLNEKARYFMNNKKQSVAYGLYDQVLNNPIFDPKVKLDILKSFIRLGEIDEKAYEKTKQYLRSVSDLHPNSEGVNLLAADFFFRDQKFEESAIYYRTIVTEQPNNYMAWRQLILSYYNATLFEQMRQTADEALSYFPTQPELFLYNGMSLIQLKDYPKAIELLEEGNDFVLSKDKSVKAQFLSALADAHHAAGDHEKSDEYFELTLKLEPNNYYVLNNYAYYLSLRKKNLARAKKLSYQSNMLNPNEASFQDTYGWILYLLNEEEEALEWLTKAIENGGAESGVINEHLGDVYFKMGNIDQAKNYWVKAKELGNHSDELVNKLNK